MRQRKRGHLRNLVGCGLFMGAGMLLTVATFSPGIHRRLRTNRRRRYVVLWSPRSNCSTLKENRPASRTSKAKSCF